MNDMPDDIAGYFDGRDLTTPRPGLNRSFIYRHCWQVGRREVLKRHWPAQKARVLAELAEAKDAAIWG